MSHIYKSSFRFSTSTPFAADDYRKAKHIINHIIDNPQSVEFREPVKWEELNLLDYPELVKNPMDLGTMLGKLNNEQYENIEEFLDDFQLIWDNCKAYNTKGTWIYGLADKLEKNGKKMLKNYFPSIPIQSIKTLLAQDTKAKSKKSSGKNDKLYYEDEEEITLDEKMKLTDKFKAFSPAQNKELVEYIMSVCPTAVRDGEQQLQIVIDNMDILTFKQVMQKGEEIETEDGNPTKKVKFE